jgi:hypothetical protein
MAATLTTTEALPEAYPGVQPNVGPSIRTYTLAWVSHTDGSVDLDTDQPIVGELLRVVFIPSGSAAPTTLYDVVLKDSHGVDVLAGQGANLSEVNTTHVCPGVPLKDGTTTSTRPVALAGVLNLEVTNAGSGKGGSVILYVR